MTQIFLRCLDPNSTADTIRLECKLNSQGYLDFDEVPHGIITENGEAYKFDLDKNGLMDFVAEDAYRTDFHELMMKIGIRIKVRDTDNRTWTFEVVHIQ